MTDALDPGGLELDEAEGGTRMRLRVKAGARRDALLGAHAGALKLSVTAAPEKVPPPLIEQLKPGGRMVAPVGTQALWQDLLLIEKRQDGSLQQKSVMPVRFVPFISDEKESK